MNPIMFELLRNELFDLETKISREERKSKNCDFMNLAPLSVVEAHKKKLIEFKERVKEINALIGDNPLLLESRSECYPHKDYFNILGDGTIKDSTIKAVEEVKELTTKIYE